MDVCEHVHFDIVLHLIGTREERFIHLSMELYTLSLFRWFFKLFSVRSCMDISTLAALYPYCPFETCGQFVIAALHLYCPFETCGPFVIAALHLWAVCYCSPPPLRSV